MARLSSAGALREAFRILERDALAFHVVLADELRGLTISCEVGGERFGLRCGRRPLVARIGRDPAAVRVATDRETILALIDGKIRLLEAIRGRRLKLIADVALMLRLSRAQRAFAEGAVRARRMRALLNRYRSGVKTGDRSYSGSSPR